MKNRYYRLLLLATVISSLAATAAFSQPPDPETKETGGNILNPLPGESITQVSPMIGVRLPQPSPPIDMETIKIFIDGDEVTSETQLSLEYIFYEPSVPMQLGTHNVLVTYQDTDGESLPPLAWSFRIVPKQMARIPVSGRPARPQTMISTTGKLVMKIKQIDVNESDRANNWSYKDIKYQEGADTTTTLDFTHKYYGNTIIGHYDRSTEQLTGRTNDRFSFRFRDADDDITLGDYYIRSNEFSEYTVNGVRMRGMKKIRSYGKYTFTTIAGRSQEPHDGRLKRMTYGLKMDTNIAKSHRIRFTTVSSKEGNIQASNRTYRPNKDMLYSLLSMYRYSPYLELDSQYVMNNHSVENPAYYWEPGEDTATKFTLTYNDQPLYLQVARRSVGPRFNPTVLGTFIETDREGNYVDARYTTSNRKLSLRTFYDVYHDNVHKQQTDNVTDRVENSRSSITYNPGGLMPSMSASYGKLYTTSMADIADPGAQVGESTNFTLRTSEMFPDTSSFTGTRLTNVFVRFDNDRDTSSSQTVLRSDTRNWSFSTRYKALAQLSFNTSENKSYNMSRAKSTPFTTIVSDSVTNTDSIGLQLSIIPFKFITNLNYRRLGRKTQTDKSNSTSGLYDSGISSAPLEYQHTITMIYYLDQRRKLQLELMNYDKEYRSSTNLGRSYDEQSLELGYSMEF